MALTRALMRLETAAAGCVSLARVRTQPAAVAGAAASISSMRDMHAAINRAITGRGINGSGMNGAAPLPSTLRAPLATAARMHAAWPRMFANNAADKKSTAATAAAAANDTSNNDSNAVAVESSGEVSSEVAAAFDAFQAQLSKIVDYAPRPAALHRVLAAVRTPADLARAVTAIQAAAARNVVFTEETVGAAVAAAVRAKTVAPLLGALSNPKTRLLSAAAPAHVRGVVLAAGRSGDAAAVKKAWALIGRRGTGTLG